MIPILDTKKMHKLIVFFTLQVDMNACNIEEIVNQWPRLHGNLILNGWAAWGCVYDEHNDFYETICHGLYFF